MTNMKPPTAGHEDTKPQLTVSSSMASASTQTQNGNGCGRMNAPLGTPTGSNGSTSASASPGCFIKPSLSLNSLPPQVPPEGSEMAQNRLRIDRPYNSLKKKRDSERELWRRSWGSGHSHSSCSLQSSTATGIGKDDFWAALQTNYNFIMDTNLLDSCREARGEIGDGGGTGARTEEDDDVDYYQKAMYKPSPMQTFYGDPRLLRQWIKEMETRIARIPSVTETKKLNIEQLLKLSGEHSEVYREIVSNSRAVAACVRAYEKKSAKASRSSSGTTISGFGSLTSTSTATTGEPSGSGSLTPEVAEPLAASYFRKSQSTVAVDAAVKLGKSKDNTVVKGLERRYHLLYLKAIEIQCLLEGLLDNKTSSSDNNASLSDTDEEPVNKLARLSSSSVKSKSPGSGQPHDECLSGEEWVKAKKFSSAGFDADSEGSDCEIVPNIISYHHRDHHPHHPLSPSTTTTGATNTTTNTPSTPPPVGILEVASNHSAPMMEADILNATITPTPGEPVAPKLLSGEDIIDGIIRDAIGNGNGNNSSSNDEKTSAGKSSPSKKSSGSQNNGGSGKQKRTKLTDLSKFNRSTRKSKNCATFYFKHADTDSELNKDSSELNKSEESTSSSSSEGDEWVYNDGQEDSGSSEPIIPLGDEDEKENKPDEKQDQIKDQKDKQQLTAKEIKSKKCLDFSAEALAGVNLSSRALMMTTSIGSFGKSSDSVDSGGKNGGSLMASKQYATSSIHRLVLHAETLVRDEIFAKAASQSTSTSSPKTAVKNPHYLHHNHHHHHYHPSPPHHLHRGGVISSISCSSNNSANHNNSNNSPNVSLNNSSNGNGSNGRKTAEKVMSNHKINRIEEWLERQPLDVAATAPLLPGSVPTTDCEASGEYTDSDSITRDTDSSEGLANSVATCLQGDQTSQELLNSTDNISNDDSTAAAAAINSVHQQQQLVKRRVRDKPAAERPWSVSCISQLNTSAVEINQYGHEVNHQNQRLLTATSFSISESALNTMSAVRGSMKTAATAATSSSGGGSQQPLMVKSSDSKGSLKKRKMRARRKNHIVESGSDESMPPNGHHSSALHLLQHSIILQHQQQLLQQSQQQHQQQQPLREIQLSAGSGSSGSGGGRQHHHHHHHQYSGHHHRTGNSSLLKSESFSGRIRLADDLVTLSSLSGSSGSGSGTGRKSSSARQTTRTAALNSTAATSQVQGGGVVTKCADSEEEQHQQQQKTAPMAKPNFKIGSVARARCGSLNLGSLAALANYNLDNVGGGKSGAVSVPAVLETLDLNGTGTGTEETGSFSEQAWDNYQEKYMSEPYSEDRDTDAARRLLDFGDDYRNFIDSQSDCASSSLSAANMDSLSPPRFRRTGGDSSASLLGGKPGSESNANSLNRRKRLDEYRMDDRYSHNMHSWSSKSGSPPGGGHHLDKTLTAGSNANAGGRSGSKHHGILYESSPDQSSSSLAVLGTPPTGLGGSALVANRRRSLRSVDKHNSFLRSLSHETSSSSNNEFDEDMDAEVKKLLIQSKAGFANTEALKAKSHLLKPEDYDEIIKTCRENVRCLETVLLSQPGTVLTAAKCQDLRDTILCWEKLLSWSERRQITTRFQAEIQTLKDGLDELGSKAFDFSSEAHIQLAIDQLKNERKVLQNQRPKMLTLNATVHSWVSQQELSRKELLDRCAIDAQLEQLDREKNYRKCADQKCAACYDCLAELREDCAINRELKDGIGQLYGTWDEAELRIKNRIENLTSSMQTWKQLEDGLSDFRDILDRDRGKLQGLEGARNADEVASGVREVVKALSERGGAVAAEPLFQEHNIPVPVSLKPLSSSGSLSDSGISDSGGMSDGSLSERERRLTALKRLVKQLEVSLAPGSEAMQTITKRLELAEHDLRSLQNTCRKIIEKGVGDGVDGGGWAGDRVGGERGGAERNGSGNNNDASVKNKNRKGSKKNRQSSPAKSDRSSRSRSNQSLNETDSEDYPFQHQVETLSGDSHHNHHQRQQQQHHQQHPSAAASATAQLGLIQTTKLKLSQNRWVWRITKIAVPVQLALVLVMCAACFFEPHCCDALNTYSMSFTPQLRYIKGPPPV